MNGLYTASSALDTFRVRQEAIAHNLANTQTVGFKRVQVRTSSFAQALDKAAAGHVQAKTQVDFTQGDLTHTGEPLDIGIDGEGFFAVQSPDGVLYTRAGALRRDANGLLVSAAGLPLQSAGGGEIKLGDSPLSDIKILGDGQIVTAGAEAKEGAKIKVVLLEGPGELIPAGASAFKADPRMREVPADEAVVHQGYRERSNAEPVQELLNMIEVHRMFESATQSIQAATRALERTSSEVI